MSAMNEPTFITMIKAVSRGTCLSLALAAALSSPAWASQPLNPFRSVLGEHEEIFVAIKCPTPTTGDLYIAASVGGLMYFYHQDGRWLNSPAPNDYGQTCSGTKWIMLGNSSYIVPGIYPVYEVMTQPNAPDVYDTRNWVGGWSSLGHTSFQIKLPEQISGDHDGDGWADDDLNHDGFHDDDSDHDGFHDDDTHHVGFHNADCKNGGWRLLKRADGSLFKNQDDCMQYVNTGK